MIGPVPCTSTLQTKFGVVNFVVHVFFKAVIATVHPCDVCVALHVHADRRVEGVGVVDGHACVVDNHEVTVCAWPSVLFVETIVVGCSPGTWSVGWVVVHLPVGVKHRHVDLTRIVGRDVDHGLNEQRHLVGTASRGEFVGLASRIGVGKGVARTVAGLCGNNTVGALNQIHEVRLNISCSAVGLTVEPNGDNACQETIVVGFLNGSFVVGLLRGVTVFRTFIGNRNHDLGRVRVPAVVRLGRGVSWNVSACVFPREACPV